MSSRNTSPKQPPGGPVFRLPEETFESFTLAASISASSLWRSISCSLEEIGRGGGWQLPSSLVVGVGAAFLSIFIYILHVLESSFLAHVFCLVDVTLKVACEMILVPKC